METKTEAYVLIGIGTIIGAIFMKIKNIPWWLITIGAAVGGFLGYFAIDQTFGDFILGAAAGAIGPYLISTVIDGAKGWIQRKLPPGSITTTTVVAQTTTTATNKPDVVTDVVAKTTTVVPQSVNSVTAVLPAAPRGEGQPNVV